VNPRHVTGFILTSTLLLLSVCLSVSFAQSNRDSPTKNQPVEKVFDGKETDQKAFLLKKVEPTKHKIEGTVVLRCVFSSTGEVTNIVVVSRLPDGLTEKAIEAARLIKFKPATKNGKAVSMYMQLEYNFNLH
jgi:TonB family protein